MRAALGACAAGQRPRRGVRRMPPLSTASPTRTANAIANTSHDWAIRPITPSINSDPLTWAAFNLSRAPMGWFPGARAGWAAAGRDADSESSVGFLWVEIDQGLGVNREREFALVLL